MNTRYVVVGVVLGIAITCAVIVGSPANPLNLEWAAWDANR